MVGALSAAVLLASGLGVFTMTQRHKRYRAEEAKASKAEQVLQAPTALANPEPVAPAAPPPPPPPPKDTEKAKSTGKKPEQKAATSIQNSPANQIGQQTETSKPAVEPAKPAPPSVEERPSQSSPAGLQPPYLAVLYLCRADKCPIPGPVVKFFDSLVPKDSDSAPKALKRWRFAGGFGDDAKDVRELMKQNVHPLQGRKVTAFPLKDEGMRYLHEVQANSKEILGIQCEPGSRYDGGHGELDRVAAVLGAFQLLVVVEDGGR
jgi:hypothetical protein